MKRIAAVTLALALLASGCAIGRPKEIKGQTPAFTNPVYVGKKDGLPEAADPMVVKFNGEYYAYVTGDPCLILRSEDLVNWKYQGPMLAEKVNCWAPDVVYKNGLFHAYLSTELPDDEHRRRVRLYTSESPLGPFKLQATVTNRYSYDADYFMASDGTEYLYWTEERFGNPTVGDRLVGMDKVTGNTTLVAHPEGWECRGRCIFEGPSTIERDGQFFMQYSGAAYENASYGEGYVRSTKPLGTGGMEDTTWSRVEQILKTVEAKVDGPGGGSWVKAPNNLDDWTIYHGRGITREDWDRWLRIDPVQWGKDRFWLPGAPTYQAQPGPALPQFRDLFARESASNLGSKEWRIDAGRWEVANGAAHQLDANVAGRALVSRFQASEYLFEANLRGVGAGVYAYWKDDKNYVVAMLGPKALTVTAYDQGKATPAKTLALPEGFRTDVWHQVIVRKNGSAFDFFVDDRKLGSAVFGYEGVGQVGLATSGGTPEFDGVALTHGWEDFFPAPGPMTWKFGEGNGTEQFTLSEQGYLVKPAVARRMSVLKGETNWASYEFTASLRQVPGPLSSPTKYGMYAVYADAKNYVEVYLDPSQRRLVTRPVLKGKAGEEQATPIEFNPEDWNTVTVIKNGFEFTVILNGKEVQKRTIQIARGQVGLVGEGNEAQFDSIRAVRWD